MGDVHPEGNPHVHLNPHNILLVASALTERLQSIDTTHADFYHNRLQQFTSRWQQAITRWEASASSMKGSTVVVHHTAFSYLLDWLQLKQVASLEPTPGIPPTASHLERLLQQLKAQPADVIIRTPYEPDDASTWLSEKTGIPAMVLPYTMTDSDDLYALFDRSIALLQEATHAQ